MDNKNNEKNQIQSNTSFTEFDRVLLNQGCEEQL